MKKIVCISAIAALLASCMKESTPVPLEKNIDTEFGLKKVIRTSQGNDAIMISKKEWDDIEQNLTYNDPKPFSQSGLERMAVVNGSSSIDPKLKEVGVKVKIKIGALKYDCKKGVGFRCGGSVGPYAKFELKQSSVDNPGSNDLAGNVVGRNPDRMYDCLVKEVDGQFMIEFLEPVDWDWLAS